MNMFMTGVWVLLSACLTLETVWEWPYSDRRQKVWLLIGNIAAWFIVGVMVLALVALP